MNQGGVIKDRRGGKIKGRFCGVFDGFQSIGGRRKSENDACLFYFCFKLLLKKKKFFLLGMNENPPPHRSKEAIFVSRSLQLEIGNQFWKKSG